MTVTLLSMHNVSIVSVSPLLSYQLLPMSMVAQTMLKQAAVVTKEAPVILGASVEAAATESALSRGLAEAPAALRGVASEAATASINQAERLVARHPIGSVGAELKPTVLSEHLQLARADISTSTVSSNLPSLADSSRIATQDMLQAVRESATSGFQEGAEEQLEEVIKLGRAQQQQAASAGQV